MIVINKSFQPEEPPQSTPKYQPGQLVAHKRYRYRGVVVSADSYCRADPVWYHSNKTQPDRAQPWYHVLVHGGGSCTYAAETSLEPDTSREPVEHPLVIVFFSGFEQGQHIRNDEPWPEQPT